MCSETERRFRTRQLHLVCPMASANRRVEESESAFAAHVRCQQQTRLEYCEAWPQSFGRKEGVRLRHGMRRRYARHRWRIVEVALWDRTFAAEVRPSQLGREADCCRHP